MPLILPKDLMLLTIEPRNVHLDVHSQEKDTRVVKPKYKVAGNRFPDGGVLFWVSTHKSYTYPEDRTVEFKYPENYEMCNAQPLKDKSSYLCIEKTDYLLDDEIYNKYTNAANGFKKVAKLKASSFKQLTDLKAKLRLNSNPSSLEKMKKITLATVGSDENVDDVLKSMGLSN